MRELFVLAFLSSCGGQHEAPLPGGSQGMRCTLRISQQGIFVDGEPRSRADAIAYCKHTAGAIIVLEDAPRTELAEMKSALEREGAWFYIRGPLCYDPMPLGCGPDGPGLEATIAER